MELAEATLVIDHLTKKPPSHYSIVSLLHDCVGTWPHG